MDGQDYLNQLAASARPNQKPKNNNFLSSPIFKVLAGGILILIIIMIAGSFLGSGKVDVKSQIVSLKYHIDNTLEVVSTYQPSVKSSDLRSISSSFQSVLSNTSRELNDYLTNTYKFKDDPETYKKEVNNAKNKSDALNDSLFDAKINGILDQVYANKIAYEISSIMSEESAIYNSTNNETLQSLLSTSYSSLETLLPRFENSDSPTN